MTATRAYIGRVAADALLASQPAIKLDPVWISTETDVDISPLTAAGGAQMLLVGCRQNLCVLRVCSSYPLLLPLGLLTG